MPYAEQMHDFEITDWEYITMISHVNGCDQRGLADQDPSQSETFSIVRHLVGSAKLLIHRYTKSYNSNL